MDRSDKKQLAKRGLKGFEKLERRDIKEAKAMAKKKAKKGRKK